jgi:hypothetical protein
MASIQVEFPGNAIPAPGYSKGGQTLDEELLYSTEGGFTQKGVTLAAGQGILPLGTLLKRNTTTKLYEKATSGADAVGFLRMSVNTGTDPEGQRYQGNIVHTGFLKLAHVQNANSGISLAGVLGGRVNTIEGFFKF